MAVLRGLPGTSGDVEAVMVRTVAGVLKALRQGKGATAASDGGAINVWKDDAGTFRCERMRHFSTLDSQSFTKLKDVSTWLRAALPIIQEVPVAAQ